MTSLALIPYTPPKDPMQFVQECAYKHSPVQRLPAELLLRVFEQLASPKELCNAAAVCRIWRQVSSDNAIWKYIDLSQAFPRLRVLDGKVWKRLADLSAHKLEVDDLPPFNKDTALAVLHSLRKQFANLRVERSGATLVTIPKGLNLQILHRIAKDPKQGNPTRITHLWAQVVNAIPSNIATYRVLVTDGLLAGSKGLDAQAQIELVASKGFDMPEALVVATQVLLTYMSSESQPPMRLYGNDANNNVVCTRCRNSFEAQGSVFNLLIGAFVLPSVCRILAILSVLLV